jgi:hypothetical protein
MIFGYWISYHLVVIQASASQCPGARDVAELHGVIWCFRGGETCVGEIDTALYKKNRLNRSER